MKLMLLRHGRAADRLTWDQADQLRPLTEEGIQSCRELFPFYQRLSSVDMIWTSPFVRAQQTAAIAKDLWGIVPQSESSLAIDQNPHDVLPRLIAHESVDLMLIGHNPHLSELAALLCGFNALDNPPFRIKKAGLVQLSGAPKPGGMHVDGYFAPRHFLVQDRT